MGTGPPWGLTGLCISQTLWQLGLSSGYYQHTRTMLGTNHIRGTDVGALQCA
jgi:hypothetical protein